MPHWEGIIDTASPEILESCNGDPRLVREALMAHAPIGANVRAISWVSGKDEAHITIEGPNAQDYLTTLEARDVVELVTSAERAKQRGTS